MTTDFGSQRLYDDIAARIELPIPDEETFELFTPLQAPPDSDVIHTPLPPTLDKLVNGFDTAPMQDPWMADEPQKPAKKKQKRSFFARRTAKKAAKKRREPAKRRENVSIAVELGGVAALSAGCWLIAPCVGLICLGLCLILMGVSISREPEEQ